MQKIAYNKCAITYERQIQQLKSKGLIIDDDNKVAHLLENISYYRLSAYWHPLEDKKTRRFKENAKFDTAFKLYCFDKELRKLVITELEKIEIAIRSKMIYILSHSNGTFWFSNPLLFKDPIKHAKTLTKIGSEYKRSDEDFVRPFRNKYSDPFPPAWMILEITSFGTLSMLYKNLKPGRDKRTIAHFFGLSDSVLETWLHSIVYLRNVCAHHIRLWNRNMCIQPQVPLQPRKIWGLQKNTPNDRTYFMLCMIRYLLQSVNPNTKFTNKLINLFEKFPNVDIKAMGFPSNWQDEPLWKI